MANAIEVTKDFPASRERAVLLELLNIMKTLKQAQIDAVICGGWVPGISLSYLYILPLIVSAILLPRRISFTLTLICVFLHDLLRPAYTSLQLRIADNLIALIGFGFAVAMTHIFVAQRNRLSELTRRQRDTLLKDVELAADVQRLFLPVDEPAIPGFEIAGMMHP